MSDPAVLQGGSHDMTANQIRSALGVLQEEPDNDKAWTELRQSLGFTGDEGTVDPGDLGASDLADLLQAARAAHEMRREYAAVADLLEIEAALATGEREAALVTELARVRDDVLLDDAGALAAYRRLLVLRPGDANAEEAIERSEAKRAKWKDLAQRYFAESKSAGDPSFKSSLLVSAAEIAVRYALPELESKTDEPAKGKKGKKGKGGLKDPAGARRDLLDKTIGIVRDALGLDPKNRRAALLLERLLGEEGRWEDLASALDTFATEVPAKDERIAALVRLARIQKRKLEAPDRAVVTYERVLDLSPGHPEATTALVDHFTQREMWDHLVSLYEGQLAGGGVRPGQESGITLQVAMVHWRMRGKPDAAEPFFERLRKHEPAHPGMLSFFREWCTARGETARLVAVLSDAQRAMPEGADRAQLSAEIAGLAEAGANAQKAIEQWRSVLRSEPQNLAAATALKRLYRETAAHNHLADLLRADLERLPADDAEGRLPVLREIAQIYREHIKSDSALVTVLSQIIALAPRDGDAVRELAGVYESLGRWRDLLTTQVRLAEIEPDPGAKAELYRAVARRWLEQFSNVQNAVEAYEKVRELSPHDREATSKLRELYTKRRAYRQLFELDEAEAEQLQGAERRALWMEMAKMASERLDRGADAARLYRQVLAEEPSDLAALDALEKQAERDKDFATVVEALGRRADLSDDPAQTLAILQKLGTVLAERLEDHAAALGVWRRVLELSPGHVKALRVLRDSYVAIGDYDGLTELYAKSSDWEGLADVLENAAERATDPAKKAEISFYAADVFTNRLRASDRAARAYERVLHVRPDDTRAAAALAPILEKDEKWARLPALYEVLLGAAAGDEKQTLLRKLTTVTGDRLGDASSALRHAVALFELSPLEPGVLHELERRARASGDWNTFARALEARASSGAAGDDEQRALRMKLAEVSAVHAGRTDDAVAVYRELAASGDEEAIGALDRLLRASPDRHDDLRWLFRLRADRASGAERVAVLGEWALLEEEAFGNAERAIAIHREILEVDPGEAHALRALGRLLAAAGDAEGAVLVLERERDAADGETRVAREVEIARLRMGPLKDPREALAAARRALEIAPNDARVIAVVEELMPLAETRAQAAVVLEQAYAAAGDHARQGEVLAVLLATAASKSDRLALHERLASVKENLGDVAGAFDVVARAAQEAPAELVLWDRLAVLANKTQRTQAFVEAITAAVPETGPTGLPEHVELDLAERAATLYDEMLGEIDRATPYLDRILARDPGNERAFLRLKQILTTRERWAELDRLYERVLAVTEDAARRADLLNEVAIIAEEITGDAKRAIESYERILELEPTHDQAIYALDKLYAAHERWPELAALLARRVELTEGDAAIPLRLRLGTLLMNRLGEPKLALDHLEEVVRVTPDAPDARELVEKCLAHKELRQRAAIILEGVYAEQEDVRNLVRVLDVRLEFAADDVERRDLLRRIAELRDDRLGDERASVDAYARLVPLAPADALARGRLVELSRRLGRLDACAEVLMVAAKNADAPQPRAEILGEVARVYEEVELDERAEAIHRQVLELAPDDPAVALPAVRALQRIYEARGRSRELAEMLKAEVRLEESGEARRELHARLGVLAEQQLQDDALAIEAWRARLDDDPADDAALAALDRLYARGGDHRALVEVLRAREQGAAGDDRKALMIRAAETLAGSLSETQEAILAYRAVLDDFGADRAVLQALARLYVIVEQWPDVADTVEAELGLVTESADRVTLLTRLGDVRRGRLQETSAAIEAYREALTIEPSHTPARAALEALLTDEGARGEAAEILRPLYETGGESEPLLRVLEIQIEEEEDVAPRLDLYSRTVEVAERDLRDVPRAFRYASRALRDAVAEPSLPAWVEQTVGLGERAGDYAELVHLLREIAPEIASAEQQVEVTLRVASLARDKRDDDALAKEYFRKVLDLAPDDVRALEALQALYAKSGENEALLEIVQRRAEAADDDDERRGLLYEQARVCDELLGDRDRAIAAYEDILELGMDAPAQPAIVALQRLYATSGRWGDLVTLYERELGMDGVPAARRADLHFGLGRVHDKELAEMDRAFDEYAEAIRLDNDHASTTEALEALMLDPAHAGRAAEMLEQVYLSKLDWRKVMGAVEARLRASEDPEERRTLLRRLAGLHEEQEESYASALEVTARLLAEDVTDETTWAELERLARVAGAEARLAEIYAAELEKVTSDEPSTARLALRAGEIFEGQRVADKALVLYRRAYDFSPEESPEAFRAIDRLLEQAGKASERVALYRGALEYRTDPEERVATLRTIAAVEEEQLGDDDAASQTLRAIVDVDETDAAALDGLARLYTRRERWSDLADLLRRRAEQSALPEEEAKWRGALAGVLDTRRDDTAGAIDELETVIGLVSPSTTDAGRAAVGALEALLANEDHKARVVELLRPIYEAGDDWRKLVDLGAHRRALAVTPHEKVSVLRDDARLLEERGSDLDGAFDRLREAFAIDPDDGDTREEMDRLAVATERWDHLAEAYEAGVEKIDGVGKRELLESLAKLHDKRRDDPRRALDAWDRLFQLDESDPHPLDEMDQLATLLSDWATLVRVLAKRAELSTDEEERASLWRRIGEARRDMLEDVQGAIDAYERALSLEPESAFTLDNLIPLYEGRSDAARLVDLYRRRIALCGEDDGDLEHQLLLDASRCYEVGLGDRREAIALLDRALAKRPGDAEVLRRLAGLYEAEEMWPDLLDNLRLRAGAEQDEVARAALTLQVGKLYSSKLDDHAQALDAFRDVLAVGYDEEAARSIREIGEAREELRRDAAAILEPALRAAGRSDALVDVLELRLRAETVPAERVATLRQIATIAEDGLRDASRALDALLRALALVTPETREDLAAVHAEASRIAGLLGRPGWERYAETLSERAGATFEASLTADLNRRLGAIAEVELGDLGRAAEAYARAAEQGGDDAELLGALERVHAGRDDTRALLDVLERRIAVEPDPLAQADLHYRLASLQIRAGGDRAAGLGTLRLALEKAPDHGASRATVTELLADDALFDEAFEILETSLRATGRGAELGQLFARKVDRAEGTRDRTRARLALAAVLEREGGDVEEARRTIEAAIVDDPHDAAVIAELERLAEATGGWAKASSALARALEARRDTEEGGGEGAGSAALWARLGRWRQTHEGDERGAELAFARAHQLDPENVELVRSLESLLRAPGRERDRVSILRRLARLEGEPAQKRELARESLALSEGVLADRALAEEVLREVLRDNDADAWALEELTRLRHDAGDHQEVVALLLRRAEQEPDATAAGTLRHRAAHVATESLGDRDKAIALYEEILEQDSVDPIAAERLRALYAELGKYGELARLLGSLAESATTTEARSALRVDLARLQLEKFESPRDAADTLRAVLDEDPDHEDAATALAAIFESSARFTELADLWAQRVGRARERGEAELELERMLTYADVVERRVQDGAAALKIYEEVLARDENHRVALEAVARLAEERGVWDKAAAALARLAEVATGDAVVPLALRVARAKGEIGDDAGVRLALERAVSAAPRDPEVRRKLAEVYQRTQSFRELADLLVGDADILQDDNPYEPPAAGPPLGGSVAPPPAAVAEQVKLLRRAAELHLKERGAPEEAAAVLERAARLVPHDRELLLVLCDALTAAGRDRDAATVLEQVIASFGNKRTKELSIYHHRLGKALSKLGERDAALVQLDMAFKADPGSIDVLRDLGVLSIEAGDLDRAQKTFRALLLQRLDVSSGITKGEVFCYLGEISLKQGDKAKAVQMLERAVENEPSLERAKTMLAELKG